MNIQRKTYTCKFKPVHEDLMGNFVWLEYMAGGQEKAHWCHYWRDLRSVTYSLENEGIVPNQRLNDLWNNTTAYQLLIKLLCLLPLSLFSM